MMSLSQVMQATQGTLIGNDVMVQNVAINTRADCSGRLFVALKGENFDAHEFLDQAELAGAAAVMVEREVETNLPCITVASTHQALKDLAAWWRAQFAIPVLGITGSVGKTTVKEMLRAITAELGQGVVTEGNLNNEIGVPLTLMHLTPDDRYAVVEMGMNHAGEIGRLTAITRPTVAVVNNAGAAHLEGLGSVAAVAQAKGEIFEGLGVDGVAVINADDEYASLWSDLVVDKKTITFGLDAAADVNATYEQAGHELQLNINVKGERDSVRIRGLGEHTVRNALAAIAAAVAARMELSTVLRGLENYHPAKGRLNAIRVGRGVVFDDTYNANPASMQAAIRVLADYDNNMLIVGDMAELGETAVKEHENLGTFAADNGVDRLLACGHYADSVVDKFGSNGLSFKDQNALLEYLNANRIQSRAVLIKGSRSAKMENVVDPIKQQLHSDAVAEGVN